MSKSFAKKDIPSCRLALPVEKYFARKHIAYVAVDSAIGDYQSNNNASTEHWDTELYRQILLCVPFQKEYLLFYSHA